MYRIGLEAKIGIEAGSVARKLASDCKLSVEILSHEGIIP